MKKIIFILTLFFSAFMLGSEIVNAAAVSIPGSTEIRDVSLNIGTSGNAVRDVNDVGFRLLTFAKRIIMGLTVIFAVYAGANMVMSGGISDEEGLSGSKRSIWYILIALVFINIPGTLYEAFYKNGQTSLGGNVSSSNFSNENVSTSDNLLFDFFIFGNTLNDQIIAFLEIAVFASAVFMITLAGVQLLTSQGREERMKEAKNKILYTVLALVFVGFIEAWKRLAFGGNIKDGVNLFESISNLALFFAAPTAIFFLTLAGYYFITSNGDEERIKKAKSIIINTVIATLILLAGYTFLLDLATI